LRALTKRMWIGILLSVLAMPWGAAGAGPNPVSGRDAAVATPGDRWLEIDLYWFRQAEIAASAREFWERFEPLFAGVEGDRGVILNIGWTVSAVMEWSGDPEQKILLPTGSGQSRWVDESAPLTGTTEERKKKAAARFAGSVVGKRRGYDPWTYGDVGRLVSALKQEAARRGISAFKVGMLNLAWTEAYGEEGSWIRRHPEAFSPAAPIHPGSFSVPSGRYFDPGAALHADAGRLGGLPEGIVEGMPVHRAYAAQWGSMSRTLGLDAIMLRDSFGMPVPYQRGGPWGEVASSAEVIHKATEAVAALVKETKQANPDALVMMYSNAASAVGDWRSNGLDLETVAKQGYLDIWVDQTWAGAWNEVGVRDGDFWNNPTLGWTYQLASMLTHAAVLAESKVRHYPLIETFDAWEDWDIIHSAPERLRWGIWAYSHAAVKTPHGLKMPAGSYISWANQGERLLSEQDVRFLKENIGAAVRDAHQTAEVMGPTLVYAREAMQWQADHASPGHDVKEWIDEQAGSLMKWPVPILSVTRLEWLPSVKSDLFVLQTPSHLTAEHTQMVLGVVKSGQRVAIFGSLDGGVDPQIAKAAGLVSALAADATEKQYAANASPGAEEFAGHIPATFQTRTRRGENRQEPGARAIYSVEGSPALTINTSNHRRVVAWDPPIFAVKATKPLLEIWGGSAAPYSLAAGALNGLTSDGAFLHAAQIDLNQTMNVSAWRTADGEVHLLAAELEEGLRDDADHSRHVRMVLPASWKVTALRDQWSGRRFPMEDRGVAIDIEQARSVLLTGAP